MTSVLRVVIVDDEPPARTRLRQMLLEAGDVAVVGEAGDGDEARGLIEATRPDMVFLDVDMPGPSGTAVAASLSDPRPFIVFATAFERYALDAFAVDATDYLLKPITRSRLAGTLARVRERISRQTDLERELVAASATQTFLLPRVLPEITGYDSAAITLPARGVGGDFYIAQAITTGRFVLALGDVSGKGMPAGLVASSLQARIETLVRHAGKSASAVVADVNQRLCATSDTARFATLVYMDLDVERAEMHVVNAGHLPVFVLAADGTRTLIESNGPALGVLLDARFAEAYCPVPAGAVVVAYSDGVTEALNDEEDEFGEARLAQEIERGRELSATDLCRRLLDIVHSHRGGRAPNDDTTVMVIKRARA